LLSKLLGDNSVISTLDLSDNQIHSEGGRYLARGLRENDSLLSLNLRLNRLEDEGCRLLFEGIQDNLTLTDINIGCNGAAAQAAQTIFSVLRDQEHKIRKLDISGNDFDANQFEMMRLSLGANKSLISVDVRNNPGTKDAERAINEIEKIVHNNEINCRKLNNYPI
jgi:Ran GTPase-activating protein (RanGAP) involved in mRNA processing and transport